MDQIEVTEKDGVYTIGRWDYVKSVAQGTSTQCHLVIDRETGEKRAMLIMASGLAAKHKIKMTKLLAGLPHTPATFYASEQIQFVNSTKSRLPFYVPEKCALVIQQYIEYPQLTSNLFDLKSPCSCNDMNNFFAQLVRTVRAMHRRNIFHFDLKPEQILTDGYDFYIVDFGSAQEVVDSPGTVYDAAVPGSTKITVVYGTTEAFSPAAYDQHNGYVLCDKFDVYSLGAILYYITSGKYLDKPLILQLNQLTTLKTIYCPLGIDLLLGMTHYDPVLRYSLDHVLTHPMFAIAKAGKVVKGLTDFTCSQKLHLLSQFHIRYGISIRQIMNKRLPKCRRSQSCAHLKYVDDNTDADDDITLAVYQALIRKPQFVRGHAIDLVKMTHENHIFMPKILSSDQDRRQETLLRMSYQLRDEQLIGWSHIVMSTIRAVYSDNIEDSLPASPSLLKKMQKQIFLQLPAITSFPTPTVSRPDRSSFVGDDQPVLYTLDVDDDFFSNLVQTVSFEIEQ